VGQFNPQWQAWAGQVQQMLREAGTAVRTAKAGNADHLDPALLADLRERYDQAVGWGISTNRHRAWKDGKNHPGYVLASRLKDKADQVWLWARKLRRPLDQQRVREGPQKPQTAPEGLRVLAHSRHRHPVLPRALLPDQRP
jgi:hypothetical protein